MKRTKLLTASIFFLTLNFAIGQSYVGHSIDNYSGIQGVIYNPSSIVGSHLRADINLVSASVFGGSDYFGINVSDIMNSNGGFDFEEDTKKFPSNANNFFFNVDIVGPSFMFNLNKKSSIGIVTRVRANMNINNINGELYEAVVDGFDTNEDFSIYPSPTKNWLNIKTATLSDARLSIYDSNGRLVIKQSISGNLNVLNIETLQSGFYILKIQQVNNSVSKRFIKQ